ncbi:MAG: ribbon-helix-helix domain-containing protein [bacterium]|nr:ribbon-helix-helix domain-containing protein [bacterium]MCY3889598.1 ribbon-helix-helix domain-containing protein [bacterium]MCY3961743.1 ribbon-helix-helix domain-containing protein [bacterium]MCY4133790.1 ribbon-helix-helix domain-containing protein [bacterium]
MSAVRTQVYLRQEQRMRIDELAQAEGVTMAEVIRSAVDAYLASEVPEAGDALSATFGVLPAASAPDRDEWASG